SRRLCCLVLCLFCLRAGYFFHSFYSVPCALRSFPTRRSSDLAGRLFRWWSYHRYLGNRLRRRYHQRFRVYVLADHPGLFPNADEIGRATRLNSSHVSISYAVFCLKKNNARRLILLIAVDEAAS